MQKITGALRKMTSNLESPVAYQLPVGDESIALNSLLGKTLDIEYTGEINCVACGRKTKKSFGQGHCYPCFRDLAQCDICIVRPERCHYDQGTCREPQWGETHCIRPHVVYLANTSGLKVGITRATQVPTRWIDQGAAQALPILTARSRYLSGLAEVLFKDHVADKTNWRTLLKASATPMDLTERRDELFQTIQTKLVEVNEQHGPDALTPLEQPEVVQIDYPVQTYPEKISSLNLDKSPHIHGQLQGIKGQYLLFDCGVINIRKYAGYQVSVQAG